MKDKIYQNTEISMKEHVNKFENYTNTIRIGSLSKDLVNKIQVKYNNKLIPLNKLANITLENFNTLIISAFDVTLIPAIKKSILLSELDLNPISEKTNIRIVIPKLSEERRLNLIKIIHREAELCKISIRNVRRDSNLKLKNLLKCKIINKDEVRYTQNKIQKITDTYINKVKDILLTKEKMIIKV